ncbi:hypothetical protein GIB67_014989 [Kingdonia uniflora]|uniref:Uncharacterized protein n=1 Tax=Kingdonia uniflora TaxID=39325 RepID=A0A7J7MTG1_9MAGN|nr:hypothetical protein GIB67_014989 [Kingdonia uniflora]
MVVPSIDNIRSRASGWSGKLLFFQSRVVLVKSILTILPIYNMAIYKWPIAAVKDGERIIRNFLWSGDPAKFLRAKFLNKEGLLTQYYKISSIWTGLKEAIVTVKAHSKWIIGSGKDIDFWRDCWGSDSAIYDLLEIPDDIWKHCMEKLSQIIHHNTWSAPPEVVELLGSLGINLNGIILNSSDKDIRVWKHCPHDLFSVHSAFQHTSSHAPKIWWYPFTNSKVILPRIASFAWRICHNSFATEDLLIKRGLHITLRCSLCRCNLENMQHLFWNCPWSTEIWDWIASLFQLQAGFTNLKTTLESCKHLSSYLNDIWKAAVLNIVYLIWIARNAFVLEGFSHSINDIKRRSLVAIKDAVGLSCNSMANSCLELSIVAALGVPIKARPLPRIQSTTWALPRYQEVKINCGAAAIGATGKAGVGAAARNHLGDVLGVLTKGLGNTTLFFSECEAILGAIDWAVQNNWKKIWIESDSQTAISDFIKNHVPWPQRARWNRMKTSFKQIRFSHCWKVANFSAYQTAKRGVSLPVGNLETFLGRPHF